MKIQDFARARGPAAGLEKDLFACPECSEPLQERQDALGCPKCQRRWPVRDGVPHFIEEFPYWGEVSREQIHEINRLAATGSWKAALLNSTERSVQRVTPMLLNLERANWQWLLDLPAESRVLDLGAGMGANSHALARHYREVVALEPVLERIEFMQHRFSQEQLSNIKIVRSSLWTIPFAPESFDLIVMNGVLEWVAEGQLGDPGEVQESALKRMCRLLRPGGALYVGIENRLGYEYFVGYLDPHCRLPFVTILPRRLAHWYARRKGRNGGYRNYLYSSRGYRELLLRAGFSRVEVYLALPDYNHPRFYVPLEDNVFSHYSQNFNPFHGARWREFGHWALLKSGLLKYMENSFAILARK